MLDLIFPKFCVGCKHIGGYLCDNCFPFLSFDTKEKCLICGLYAIGGVTHPSCYSRTAIDGSFSAIAYTSIAKKLLYQFKYEPYVTGLTTYLGDLFFESLIQKEYFQRALTDNSVFVPIPLYPQRLKTRGYNQADLLATYLAKRFHLKKMSGLKRVKNTVSQYGLSKEERKKNMQGAFAVESNKQKVIRDKNIFLVDDILTTGATFVEAARLLKKNGAQKVWGIALARD